MERSLPLLSIPLGLIRVKQPNPPPFSLMIKGQNLRIDRLARSIAHSLSSDLIKSSDDMWSCIKSHLLQSLCLCCRSSNTSPWAFLPDEILIEILSRLPAKSLIRFQCVSKSWRVLISQHLHSKLPRLMSGLFAWNTNFIGVGTERASMDTSLSFLPCWSPSRFCIIDCCNGLLLLSDRASLYVCNPATRRWARISNPRLDAKLLVLVFDPCSSTHFKILSFPVHDVYRLHPRGLEGGFHVFSSETGKWRYVDGIRGLDQVCFADTRITFLEGMIFIMVARHGRIFSFNNEGRYCQQINCPKGMHAHCFGLSRGQLHSAFMRRDEVHVWVLLKDGSTSRNSYVWKHRKSFGAIKLPHGEVVKRSDVPFFVEAFHPHLDLIYLRCRDKLFSYRSPSAKVEVVRNVGVLVGRPSLFAYSPCYSEDIDLPMQ